jgi:hypothetical protein
MRRHSEEEDDLRFALAELEAEASKYVARLRARGRGSEMPKMPSGGRGSDGAPSPSVGDYANGWRVWRLLVDWKRQLLGM